MALQSERVRGCAPWLRPASLAVLLWLAQGGCSGGSDAPADALEQAPAPMGEAAAPQTEEASDAEGTPAPELLPGVRVDRARGFVEFDGHVPIDVNDYDPLGYYKVVFLECVVTTPLAEKDHETLVVTDVRPSNLHAALLAIGAEPGAPGDWRWDGHEVQRIAARGDEIEVKLVWTGEDGARIERNARDLIVNEATGEHFGGSVWVFAGSLDEPAGPVRYAADATGLLVGLTTFGTEVIAWREVISHVADIDTPVWIADRAATPAYGTEVTVRLERTGAAP